MPLRPGRRPSASGHERPHHKGTKLRLRQVPPPASAGCRLLLSKDLGFAVNLTRPAWHGIVRDAPSARVRRAGWPAGWLAGCRRGGLLMGKKKKGKVGRGAWESRRRGEARAAMRARPGPDEQTGPDPSGLARTGRDGPREIQAQIFDVGTGPGDPQRARSSRVWIFAGESSSRGRAAAKEEKKKKKTVACRLAVPQGGRPGRRCGQAQQAGRPAVDDRQWALLQRRSRRLAWPDLAWPDLAEQRRRQ